MEENSTNQNEDIRENMEQKVQTELGAENPEQNKATHREIVLNGRKITLIGTAHVSAESIKDVEEAIKIKNPDCVCIELDEKRADSIQNPDKYRNLDIVKVLKNHEGFLLLANLVLSSFQRRMGLDAGVKPGDEMLAGMKAANELGVPAVMVDRPIQVTLKRAWKKNNFWGKCKLLATLLSSAFSKEEIPTDQVENLKNGSEMDSMMKELADYMPVVKEVLIDERDRYLASKIWDSTGNNIVAVLGAGHLNGVEAYLEKLAEGSVSSDVTEISEIPAKSVVSKILPWIIPAAVLGLFIAGFVYGGVAQANKVHEAETSELVQEAEKNQYAPITQLIVNFFENKGHPLSPGAIMIITWFLWNGIPTFIGTLIAGGNPLVALVGFVSAPFTSMCPFVGVGFVTGILQAIICKPRISDMETLQDDVSSLKGWYKNRILRVLLVFLLSSIGSTIGTFAGGGNMIKIFTEIE